MIGGRPPLNTFSKKGQKGGGRWRNVKAHVGAISASYGRVMKGPKLFLRRTRKRSCLASAGSNSRAKGT